MSTPLNVSFVGQVSRKQTSVATQLWGHTADNEAANLYTLSNDVLSVTLSDFGARIINVLVPDRNGRREDVVLGYKNLEAYEADTKQYFGATIGRFANRIANASFSLGGILYKIPTNNGINALHGGPIGLDRKIWTVSMLSDAVEMNITSEDGEMGFPGELRVWVRFSLSTRDLIIEYGASTNKPTVANLTNHSYFNLAGESSGNVGEQRICIAADYYTPVNSDLIPTGILDLVEGTPFDFRRATAIRDGIDSDHSQIKVAGGYDHNFVLRDAPTSQPRLAAHVVDLKTGRTLTVSTTEPGLQFYSGNFLDDSIVSKAGGHYERNAGFCLETQHFPDSPNQPQFPSTVLLPGRPFSSTTSFSFGVDDKHQGTHSARLETLCE